MGGRVHDLLSVVDRMKRVSPKSRMAELPSEIRTLWQTRHDEPPPQVFTRFPRWMAPKEDDPDLHLDFRRLVADALQNLRPQERNVLVLRYWQDLTLEEVGLLEGLSKERIRQIEAKALRKIKRPNCGVRPYVKQFFMEIVDKEVCWWL